jgi:hypothetical protein
MQRRSWVVLGVCILIAGILTAAYIASQHGPERLTQQDAIGIVQGMESAFEHKNPTGVLAYISPSPDTRISSISTDQLHLLLGRYFRYSDRLSAETKNYLFTGGDGDAVLQFDLVVHNDGADSRKEDYSGRITLHLRRVEIPHLLGLYQTREWRITGAETTGPDLSTFGD